MNLDSFHLAERLMPATYVRQGNSAKRVHENKIRQLIEQRKWPEEGWDDLTIELLLQDMAVMDSNNFPGNCGVGERESRIYSNLVAKRHFHMGHGIGRSGDLTEMQPKAAGSSLMNRLTNSLALDALRNFGVKTTAGCFVVPMATGMSIVLCLLAVRQSRPQAKYVIWSRIDQKTCYKCITTAGFEPIVVELLIDGDELRTDVATIEAQIHEYGSEQIAAVLTTTSCFAPRAPDRLEEASIICKNYEVPHVINNAYGLESTKCMHLVQQAAKVGRVDAYVQSTDKNFLVPVGGTIIAGFEKKFVEQISKTYPGRASSAPSIDLFITLLSMGVNGYKQLVNDRKKMYTYLREEMEKVAVKYGERMLDTKNNPISLAMTLQNLPNQDMKSLSHVGSMLFMRNVSGTRVITGMDVKEVAGRSFTGWGAHCDSYPVPYITAAAAIGMTQQDVDLFAQRLDKVMAKAKSAKRVGSESEERTGSKCSGNSHASSSTEVVSAEVNNTEVNGTVEQNT